MTTDDIRVPLRRFIETELAAGAGFADDESLMESGVLSSMGIARLIQFMNDHFHVAIDDAEFEPDNFETLDAMTALVGRKRGAA
jgi:methoxymalonate biosynthesis acyl carrier protein